MKKTRNYGLPIVSYLDDSSKENDISGNLIVDTTDSDNSSKKRQENCFALVYVYYFFKYLFKKIII